MSTEENKALARRWFEEVVNTGNLALADELLGPGYVIHFPGMPTSVDREGHKGLAAMFRTGFPDWQETVEAMIAEGDLVASRLTGRGTHLGKFQDVPPTGRRVTVTGMGIDRISGGKIVEEWAEFDALGLMQQLGAIPAPGEAGD